jgi:hypothetical protein
MQHRSRGAVLSTTVIALGLGCSCAARAGQTETPSWSVSGYGTLGAVRSSLRDADFTATTLHPSGAGVSRRWSTDVDTNFGMQLDGRLNRQWSAVLQVVSEQRLDNTYRPKVEWANIKYQVTPELALRAGRIALPIFLTADYRRIGYIYPWVRPPVETYGSLPFTSSDGVDATWRWTAGPVRHASQVFVGHDDIGLLPPLHAVARHIVGLSNSSDWGALNVRVSLIQAEATIDIADPLLTGFRAFGPAGVAIAQHYAIDHKMVRFANIGFNYDPGNWFLMGETGTARTNSFLGATRSLYVSAGYRWKALTPYLTHAQVRALSATHDAGLPLAGLPPAYAGAAAQLDAGLGMLLAAIPQQSSDSIGLRWDVAGNAALKMQYDRVTPHDGSRGSLINTTPAFRSEQPSQVTSVALSFVY